MARGVSPQLGFNTNIRHKGKVYHVQTEDSGVSRPHVTTHLFADGGRIVDSRKTDYSQHVGAANLHEIVKKLMQDQHKGLCIALRDGAYDNEGKPAPAPAPATAQKRASMAPPAAAPTARMSRKAPAPRAAVDVAAFDRAAEMRIAESPITRAPKRRRKAAEPAARSEVEPAPRTPARPIRGKTLDDVILAYLDKEGRKIGK